MTITEKRIMLTEMLNRAHYMMGYVSENKDTDEAREAVDRWYIHGRDTLILWCSTYNDWDGYDTAMDSLDETRRDMMSKINRRELW